MDLLSRLYGTPGLVPGMQMMQQARQSMLPEIYAGLEPSMMQLIQGQMALPGLEAQFDAAMQPQVHPEVESLWNQFMQAKQAPMPQINQTQAGVAMALGGMGDVMRGNGSQQGVQNAQAQVTMSRNDMLMHRMDTLDTLQQAYARAAKSADTGDELTRRKLLEKRDSLLKQMLTIQEGLRESGLKSADIRAGLEGIRMQVDARKSEGAADRASQERIAAGHDATSLAGAGIRAGGTATQTPLKPGDYQRYRQEWAASLRSKKGKTTESDRAQFAGLVLQPIAGETPMRAADRVMNDMPFVVRGKLHDLPQDMTMAQLLAPAVNFSEEDRKTFLKRMHALVVAKWDAERAKGNKRAIELTDEWAAIMQSEGFTIK